MKWEWKSHQIKKRWEEWDFLTVFSPSRITQFLCLKTWITFPCFPLSFPARISTCQGITETCKTLTQSNAQTVRTVWIYSQMLVTHTNETRNPWVKKHVIVVTLTNYTVKQYLLELLTESPLKTDQSSGATGSTNTFLLLFPGGFSLFAAGVHGLFVP